MENKEYINIKDLADMLFSIFRTPEENKIVTVKTNYVFGGKNYIENHPECLYNSDKYNFIIEIGSKDNSFAYNFKTKFDKNLLPFLYQEQYTPGSDAVFQYAFDTNYLSFLEVESDTIENYGISSDFYPPIVFWAAVEETKYSVPTKVRKKDE